MEEILLSREIENKKQTIQKTLNSLLKRGEWHLNRIKSLLSKLEETNE